MTMNGSVNIELWAVVLGATETLLNLEMPYGYKLKRLKLAETPLYEELMNSKKSLDVKYLASNLSGNDMHEFIVLYKDENKEMPLDYFTIVEMINGNEMAKHYFESKTNEWNKEVFRILSILRLAQEGNIEVANTLYKMKATYECNIIERRGFSCKDSPISVYDDLYEWNNDNIAYFEDMVKLPEDLTSKLEDIMERFGRGYSSSRYDDAYKNLVTLSEIILIGYNSEDKNFGKRQKFAKRLAAAISEDGEAQSMHDKALKIYTERSNEVHEGNNLNITKEDLVELRCVIRKLIQNFISFCKSNYNSITNKTFKGIKREYILGLLAHIETLQANDLLQH